MRLLIHLNTNASLPFGLKMCKSIQYLNLIVSAETITLISISKLFLMIRSCPKLCQKCVSQNQHIAPVV